MAIDAVKVINLGPPELSIHADVEFLEGSAALASTLTVSAAPTSDLEVALSGDAFLSLPPTVTILAGQTSVDFSFSIVDDAAVQGDRAASITASATDHTSGVHDFTVYDDETTYTVTFDLDGKGTLDSGDLVQNVIWGESAAAPTVLANTGWHFTGWEIVHFGATNLTDGSIDSDGDGDLDVDEFESGNDPMDKTDYFRVMEEAVLPVDGQVTLRFSTNDDVGSRRYKIWYTDDLAGDWIEHSMGAFSPDAGNSTEKTFAAPGSADAYFFKVEAFIEE